VNDDLAAYLDSIHERLLVYLDAHQDLSVETVSHLYRYAVALLQGLIDPDHVREDWEDFFCLADAFVLAYGSTRLGLLNRRAALLFPGSESEPASLSDADRVLLVALVRELGEQVSARLSTGGSGPR
jgi:hypothetical protein